MISKKKLFRIGAAAAAPLLYRHYFQGAHQKTFDGKKSAVCFSFDCDLQEDYDKLPELLDTLKSFKVKGTFGIIGKWLEQEPEIHRRMVREGHEIMNHTYSHPNNEVFHPDEYFNQLSPQRQKEQIVKFHACAQENLGVSPIGFRTPHFGDLHTPEVYKILEELGYHYSSSTMMTQTHSKGQPYFPSKRNYLKPAKGADAYHILEIPSASCPVHFVPGFDTVHCIRQKEPAHPGKEFATVFKKALQLGIRHCLPQVFDFGPQDVGGNPDFDDVLEMTIQNQDVRIFTIRNLAQCIQNEATP